jgi:hypothetical protein
MTQPDSQESPFDSWLSAAQKLIMRLGSVDFAEIVDVADDLTDHVKFLEETAGDDAVLLKRLDRELFAKFLDLINRRLVGFVKEDEGSPRPHQVQFVRGLAYSLISVFSL